MSDDTIIITALVALLFCATAWLAIWSRRKDMALARHGSVFLLLFGLAAVAAVPLTSGWPLPLSWETRSFADAKVVGAWFDQGKAIFIMIVRPNEPLPRTYKMPWSDALANQLHRAMQATGEQTGEMSAFVKEYYDPSDDEVELQFYAPPQAATPPKTPEPSTPFFDPEPEQ